jgi:hypothetical protein
MKRITFLSIVLVAALSAVGFAETKSDFDHQYRLSRGRTWDFQTMKSSATDPMGPNGIWDQRVREDLGMELRSAGLPQTQTQTPDLLVRYRLGARNHYETEYVTSGFGGYYGRFGYRRGWGGWGWGGGWGPGWATTRAWRVPDLKSTLVMEVYDAHTNQLVWRGYDARTIDYNKADSSINKAAEKLSKRFAHDMKLNTNES